MGEQLKVQGWPNGVMVGEDQEERQGDGGGKGR